MTKTKKKIPDIDIFDLLEEDPDRMVSLDDLVDYQENYETESLTGEESFEELYELGMSIDDVTKDFKSSLKN